MKRIPSTVFVGLILAIALVLSACGTGGPRVNQPDQFEFEPVTAAEPGATVTSDPVELTGSNASLPASVEGGDAVLLIDGEVAGEDATAAPGAELQVRMTASTEYEETVTATVTVGEVSASFSVTTRGPSTTPNEFEFEPVTGAEPGATVTSDPVELSGFDGTAAATVTEPGVLVINGTATTGPGPFDVEAGDTIAVTVPASTEFETGVTVTVTVGGVEADFTVTTRAEGAPGVQAFEADTDDPQPNQEVTLTWTVTGDFDELVLTNDFDDTEVPLDTSDTETTATLPGNAPSITYTLTATNSDTSLTDSESLTLEMELWVCSTTGTQYEIVIPNEQLRNIITAELGVDYADLDCADMQSLTEVVAENSEDNPGSIDSLVGLQHAVNLDTLDVQWNEIADLAPIAGLTELTVLNLDKNRVTDISVVSNFENLTLLGLWDNGPEFGVAEDGITDISAVSELTNLDTLFVSWNDLDSLEAIRNLSNLRVLYANVNGISDLSPLAGKPLLEELRLDFQRATVTENPDVLAGLTALETLSLEGHYLTDTDMLEELSNLTFVSLHANNLTSVSGLAANTDFAGPGAQLDVSENCLGPDAAADIATIEDRDVDVEGYPGGQAACAGGLATLSEIERREALFQEYLRQGNVR